MLELILAILVLAVLVLIGGLAWLRVPRALAEKEGGESGAIAKREKRYRQLLGQYFGGSAVVIGILVSLFQNHTANQNFQEDYAARVGHDRRDEFFKSVALLQSKDEGARTAAIYSIALIGAHDPELRPAMNQSILAFIRRERDIDAHPERLNLPVTGDIQAAIRALGRVERPAHQREWDDYMYYNLSRLALVNGDFSNGDFSVSNFHESNLRRADFAGAKIVGSNFTVANFDYRCLDDVIKEQYDHNQIFPNAFFQSAGWWQQQVRANFDKADASGALFWGADLFGAHFGKAVLHGTQFDGSDLTFVDFDGSQLEGANFTESRRMGEVKGVVLQRPADAYHNDECGKENMWNLGTKR